MAQIAYDCENSCRTENRSNTWCAK